MQRSASVENMGAEEGLFAHDDWCAKNENIATPNKADQRATD